MAAAAVLALVLSWPRSPLAPLPADLVYEVTAEGLAQVRDGADPASPAATAPLVAYADTRILLSAEPNVAVGDVDLGLYRRRAGGDLERLALEPSALELERGAARVTARAAELLGEAPSTGRLFLVVARRGDLPAVAELPPGDPLDSLAGDGRRRVEAIDYRLLDVPEPP